MMDQRASPSGEVVLLENRDIEASFGESGCSCHATRTSTYKSSGVHASKVKGDQSYQRL